MAQSIRFLGAAETVTGSRHLLDINGKLVLVDCGLFQGSRELKQRNWQPFAVPASDLDCIVITHAHLDHIGYLPKMVREGYKGPIYATPATIELCKISLPDSGRLQEEDARYHNKHESSGHQPALPLYTENDAYQCLKLFQPVHYYQNKELPGGATFRYMPAGHILGSAFAQIFFDNGQQILMSGDLGRFNTPFIKDPTSVDFAEYLVIESTYGDRLHAHEDTEGKLAAILKNAFERGGVVMVPSFAIGRTQELLYYINNLQNRNEIPRIPIFVDSPMAVSTTGVFAKATEEFDEDMKMAIKEGDDPLHPEQVVFVRDREQSKQLNSQRGPMVIIAGSGMANGGRIVHHLLHRLSSPENTVLFTGYQAEGTLGRRLLEGASHVHILRSEVRVEASVEKLNSLSAHADQGEILQWLRNFKTPPKHTFIVHGEPNAQHALAEKITSELGWNLSIPKQGEQFEL